LSTVVDLFEPVVIVVEALEVIKVAPFLGLCLSQAFCQRSFFVDANVEKYWGDVE